MTETWADMEFGNLDLGDERLNKRAVKLCCARSLAL